MKFHVGDIVKPVYQTGLDHMAYGRVLKAELKHGSVWYDVQAIKSHVLDFKDGSWDGKLGFQEHEIEHHCLIKEVEKRRQNEQTR